jgi:hypothetical protein
MMTLEMVLLLALYVFIVVGIFVGDNAITGTFRDSAPNLAAQVERSVNIPTNQGFGGEPARSFAAPTARR